MAKRGHQSESTPSGAMGKHGKRASGANAGAGQAVRRRMTNPRELVVETLIRIENGGYSNIVWDLAMRHADLNALDKMLATRIFYGTLSNIRLIDALWNEIEPEMLKRADPIVRMTLRSAMYQLYFLDRVPAYSIVSTSVDVVKRLRNRAASGYCNALLRKAVARQEAGTLTFHPTGNQLSDFAIQFSLNDELAGCLLREFGQEAAEIAESMLNVPRMVLRVNQSKTNMDAVVSKASPAIEPSSLLPETACSVMSRSEIVDKLIENGDVCVQDEAAQMAVHALGKTESWGREGQTDIHIWDACAGMGGKSIHLIDEIACDKSGKKFSLLSTDLYANKLEKLRDYQQKYFSSIRPLIKVRDLTQGGSVPLAPFDVILVDAPCSGLGVLRRHPEVKMTRTMSDIESLVRLQKLILDNVSRHLKVGGIMVYAVCTITHEECEGQVDEFLKTHPNFRADILPANGVENREENSWIKLLPNRDG